MKKIFIIAFIGLLIMTCKEKKQSDKEKVLPLTPKKRIELALSVRNKPVELTGKEKAIVYTNKGEFIITLYSKDAPNTVKNFIRLAESGFYNGLIFHRYIPGFVIQGGDPYGTGYGNAGYTIPFEKNSKTHEKGAVGMARGPDPNSASCQFYICLAPQHQLDGQYVVFGIVEKGMNVVEKLRKNDTILKIKITR